MLNTLLPKNKSKQKTMFTYTHDHYTLLVLTESHCEFTMFTSITDGKSD